MKQRVRTVSDADIAKAVMDDIFRKMLSHKVKEPRVARQRDEELHPSSYPYCGLQHAYNEMYTEWSKQEKEEVYDERDVFGEFFTSVGTIVHEILQKWITLIDKDNKLDSYILGDFHCINPKCKHVHELSRYTACIKCGADTRYEELGIKDGKRTVGHLDGLVFISILETLWVIDYKTTVIRAINEHRERLKAGKKGYFPYGYNVRQIESYATYLKNRSKEEPLFKKIQGWILIYVARDQPGNFEIVTGELDKKKFKKMKTRLALWDEQFDVIKSGMKKGLTKTDIQYLHDTKPCPDAKWYELHQKSDYSPCPLAIDGLCWKEKEVLAEVNSVRKIIFK